MGCSQIIVSNYYTTAIIENIQAEAGLFLLFANVTDVSAYQDIGGTSDMDVIIGIVFILGIASDNIIGDDDPIRITSPPYRVVRPFFLFYGNIISLVCYKNAMFAVLGNDISLNNTILRAAKHNSIISILVNNVTHHNCCADSLAGKCYSYTIGISEHGITNNGVFIMLSGDNDTGIAAIAYAIMGYD